jgi:hypothetical protein
MDDRSRYAEVVCLKSKDMVTQAVIDMIVEWERQTGQRIKTLRTDHGTEDKVYQAIQWSLLAWKEKVIANTVKNCWRKSGLLHPCRGRPVLRQLIWRQLL